MNAAPRILVVGANGLIGSAIARSLCQAGYDVAGLGRSTAASRPGWSASTRVRADLRTLATPADWLPHLVGITHVVNAAGVLQDGGADDLRAVHVHAITALSQAAAKRRIKLIQISAAGASLNASTSFLRTKAEGDIAIEQSGARYVILQPTLVIASDAYGGTGFLRSLAATPFILPIALADSRIQTVDVADVVEAVARAVSETLAANQTYILTSPDVLRLEDVVLGYRDWLGVPKPSLVIRLPFTVARALGHAADLLGHLGWRSPLRSTALGVLREGVTGDDSGYRATNAPPLKSFRETLARYPASQSDRKAANLALAMPVLVATLSIFWLFSGVVGLTNMTSAATILTTSGWPSSLALLSVVLFSVADLALGAAILVRRWARTACLGMIVLGGAYLVGATIFTPSLWLDPLGPLAKILPATACALACLVAISEER